jgi:hypothetical protein
MSTANKLPANLPALPKVPEGFDAWELCGWGGLTGLPVGCPFAHTEKGLADWMVWTDPGCQSSGYKHRYYIRAIKRPAKLKKPKQAQAVKAVCDVIYGPDGEGRECFVLPADAASVERMREQAESALTSAMCESDDRSEHVRAVLASLGITSAKGQP